MKVFFIITVVLSILLIGIVLFWRGSVNTPEEVANIISKQAGNILEQMEHKGLRLGSPVFIRIFKEEQEFELWVKNGEKFELFKSWPIRNYSGSLGPKLKEGDCQAPEGFYFVTKSAMNPRSRFHLSFNLGYPNNYDRAHGRTGSFLMVHGGSASVGCYAMTDPVIEEIYTIADKALENGQNFFRVHCFPFRMTKANMERHSDNEWIKFWQNLKVGYDWFENRKIPPNVEVNNLVYTFN